MNIIVEPDDGKLLLGDDASEKAISFQLAQAFYSEITEKSERLNEEFSASFILTTENIKQLHHRVIQSTAQYNVISANSSFSAKYMNDSSERFSSIERFELHAGSKGVPVEEVDINYNLLVVLPQTKKPQEYRINIRLISRTAKLESMKEEMMSFPISIPMAQFENKFTCRVTVNFVDVTVANSFISVVKGWFDSLETTELSSIVKVLRFFSHLIPIATKWGMLAGALYVVLGLSDEYLIEMTTPYQTLASFLLISICFGFVMFRFGAFAGSKAEEALDQIYQISYICLSGADKNLAENSGGQVKVNVIKAGVYVISTIVLGVVSSGIAGRIFGS